MIQTTKQERELVRYVENCPEIMETLDACTSYGLNNYYLAGGVITQLIWNNLSGKPNLGKVKDFDIVYYETNKNTTYHNQQLNKLVTHNFELDLVNQAYVHEWYHTKFGNKIEPFKQTEDGIRTWLSAFAIGVRKTDRIVIFAPYGLEDAFLKKVKPNKLTMSASNYLSMTKSFKERWNDIEVIPWNET